MAEKTDKGWQLSKGQMVSLGFSAIGDVLDYYSALNSANKEAFNLSYQSWQSAQNAEIIALEARDIIREGNERVNKMKEEGYRVRGAQKVAMGSSGFEVGSKSYKDILSSTDRQIELNAAIIRENTMSAYANKKYQQRMSEIQSDLYNRASKTAKKSASGIGSLISAGAKIATMSYFGG